MAASPYALGFSTLYRELDLDDLPITGQVPDWLNGALIRNGPARFEVGTDVYRHWFDGLAMLHRFGFENGRVSYRNRFVASKAYVKALAAGRIVIGEFATKSHVSFWRRLGRIIQASRSDNTNVTVTTIKNVHLTMGENLTSHEFDPVTLKTGGAFVFADSLGSYPGVRSAHPLHDHRTGEYFNCHAQYGPDPAYVFFRVSPQSRTREIVASIKTDRPSYCHSFGLSGRYLIFLETPLRIDRPGMSWTGKPYIENFHWQPGKGTLVHLVERETGRTFRAQAPPVFLFHHVNAFEDGQGRVLVDLAGYDSPGIIAEYYLKRVREQGVARECRARLLRLTVTPGEQRARMDPLSDHPLELPRIHEVRVATGDYRFVYGTSPEPAGTDGFPDRVVKIDLGNGQPSTWNRPGCYPSEAVFVPAPDGQAEDDGLLLSVVMDADGGHSCLQILDARDLSEVARADLPHIIPFGFHGNYYAGSPPAGSR